ncbi:MAG: aldehyde dehydrogenase [Elusimicrobia bacterium]|nr:aldehyde dehydrogenase [Elusimicrobiota bacterium]
MKLANYIGGALVAPIGKLYLDNWQPSTGEVYGQAPDSDKRDVERAVEAARASFPAWSSTPAAARSRLLRSLARAIEASAQSLAEAEALDTGKPLETARTVDIPRSAANFEFFADAVTQFSSECHAADDEALNYTLRRPLGTVGCISPWNLPLYLLTRKVAPALAMGNCVVAKPSELAPVTAYLLSKLCIEAGLPPGVLNVVHGAGAKAGAAVASHEGIRALSFTGSTQTGAKIAAAAAPAFRKLSLELGGKNPSLVFADSDFEEAVNGVLRAAFSNQGQLCLCGSRILVERTIYHSFKEALVARTRSLRVGDPMSDGTHQGAVASKAHLEKIKDCVKLARKEGGEVLCGGHRALVEGPCRKGWFFEPTLIEGLGPGCRTNQEEIFGPVATLLPFDTEEEAVALANATRYGLSAGVWTRDVRRAHRLGAKLEAGMVWVNCWMLRDLRTPFGGVKDSGLGREGGWEALRFFSEPRNVCIKL